MSGKTPAPPIARSNGPTAAAAFSATAEMFATRVSGDVAEEFQGQMDRLRPDPADIPVDEFLQPVLDLPDFPEDLLRRIERQKGADRLLIRHRATPP